MKLSSSSSCILLVVCLAQQSSSVLSFVAPSNPTSKTAVAVSSRASAMPPLLAANSGNDNENNVPVMLPTMLSRTLLSAAVLFGTTFGTFAPLPAHAADSRIVGQLQGSGLVFKDTLQIESFDDPKVRGVTLYISTFQKPITERMGKGFFTDPAYASVGCAKTGKVSIADNIAKGTGGEEVFEESRSLLFKTLRVQRLYDQAKNTVVYVSFNTRFDKGDDTNKSRFKSSLCAVSLDEPGVIQQAAVVAKPNVE